MKKPKNIKKLAKKSTGRVQLLHALPYMDKFVYIMRIDETLFTYSVVIDGQMWFDFIEADVEEGQKLTDKQVQDFTGITLATAHTTIETVLGKNNENEQAVGAEIIKVAEKAFGGKKKGKK